MSKTEDHRWDLSEDEDGYLPECDEAFEEKMEEWAARDWPQWLARQLAFPDLEVTPKADPNFWPVREYVVWFANRC
jgi:hypothetical protein